MAVFRTIAFVVVLISKNVGSRNTLDPEIGVETTTVGNKSLLPDFSKETLVSSYYQFQCDIPPEWFSEYSEINPDILWPSGRVTYQLDPNLEGQGLVNLALAMHEFHLKTCIRFEARHSKEQTEYLQIETDPGFCAISDFCYKGRKQHLKFNNDASCYRIPVLLHMLGHSLCLPHEHERSDRDNYVDFSKCPAEEVPEKHQFDIRGYPYDFGSQMHYECGGCAGGVPKLAGVKRCGQDIGNRLGILDADKINDIYNCQGCFRHRWRSTANLTELDKQSMIPFGYHHRDNQPMYLCRAFIKGEIAPGKYRLDNNTCYVPFQDKAVAISENVQVFTLPPPRNTAEVVAQKGIYMAIPAYAVHPTDIMIPVGTTFVGGTIYAAIGTVGEPGYKERAIGKVYEAVLSHASIPYAYRSVRVGDYDVLICRQDGI